MAEAAIIMHVLLSQRDTLTRDEFRRYWQDVHGPLAARLPGLDSYRQLHLEPARGWWPLPPLADDKADDADRVDGIAELSFRGTAGLGEYGMRGQIVQADEQNAFRRSVRYLADERSAGLWAMPPPTSSSGFTLVALLRRNLGVDPEAWRAWVHDELVRTWALDGSLQRLRVSTLNERDNTRNHELSAFVDHDAPLPRQYQAVLELGFADALAARRFFAGRAFADTASSQATRLRCAHVYRLLQAPVMVRNGRMSLSGLRGHSIAEVIRAAGAISQLEAEVTAMFCNPSTGRAPVDGVAD